MTEICDMMPGLKTRPMLLIDDCPSMIYFNIFNDEMGSLTRMEEMSKEEFHAAMGRVEKRRLALETNYRIERAMEGYSVLVHTFSDNLLGFEEA